MSQLIHYTQCPVCGAASFLPVLSAKDHTVSGEQFSIVECGSCTFRFTQDVPDAASISPYYKSENYISHTNTSKGLINSLYQWVRKRTLKQKRRLVEKTTGVKGGHLLDVGSGTGAFAGEMQLHGWQITGIDQFYKLTAGTYDAITMWHVLEHVHELQAYIRQLRSLLKENGKLFIAVPNYTSKEAAIYKEYWAAYDVPRHLYHFSPKSMQVLMEKHGLKLLQHKPMWFDSFYISMLSSKYRNASLNGEVGQGKTNLVTSFFNGLRSNLKAMGDVKRCSSVIYIIGK
jgi:2-polyprenyl-3-methyl-5-hydroxy-6-metoxy-1,4-benzoquinol methylase